MLKFYYPGTSRSLGARASIHLLIATGLFFSLCLVPAYAQTQIRWQCDMGSGFWDVPGNWNLNRLPGPGDDVIIDCPTRVVVTLQSDKEITIKSLLNKETLQWLDGNLNVTGDAGFRNEGSLMLSWGVPNLSFRGLLVNTGSVVENMPRALDISSATLDNRGVYELQEGGIISRDLMRPGTFNNTGTSRKRGTGTGWLQDLRLINNNSQIDVREGTLNIFGGTSSGNATYAVAGGSSLEYGYHTITGTHSGSINGSLRFRLGTLEIGSNGATFNFTGTGFQWLGGTINGGPNGLTNAGLMTIDASSCGGGQTLRGTLANTGSGERRGIVQNTRDVERDTPCALDISSATLDNRSVYDLKAGNIDGDGTFNNTGTLRKSNRETASEISATLDNKGTVEILEGDLTISGPIAQLFDNTLTEGTWKVFNDTTFNISNSDITINDANILLSGANYSFPQINNLVTNNGTLSLNGSTFIAVDRFTNTGSLKVNNGYMVASMVSNEGEVSAGDSLGVINIEGSYMQTNTGKLQIKIGGTQPAQFDQIVISDAADLDGTLDIRLINGFRPTSGDRFTIMLYGMHIIGEDFPTCLDMGGGLVFRLQYDDTSLTLVAAQACESGV